MEDHQGSLGNVANVEKMLPPGFHLRGRIRHHRRALPRAIDSGRIAAAVQDGLPQYIRLKNVAVPKKLAAGFTISARSGSTSRPQTGTMACFAAWGFQGAGSARVRARTGEIRLAHVPARRRIQTGADAPRDFVPQRENLRRPTPALISALVCAAAAIVYGFRVDRLDSEEAHGNDPDARDRRRHQAAPRRTSIGST
jgi:hypothetical protein